MLQRVRWWVSGERRCGRGGDVQYAEVRVRRRRRRNVRYGRRSEGRVMVRTLVLGSRR